MEYYAKKSLKNPNIATLKFVSTLTVRFRNNNFKWEQMSNSFYRLFYSRKRKYDDDDQILGKVAFMPASKKWLNLPFQICVEWGKLQRTDSSQSDPTSNL